MSRSYSVAEAAAAAGINANLLRSWQERHGYPKDNRERNGYRYFTEHQVRELIAVANAVREGHRIGSIINDGIAFLPQLEAMKPEPETVIAELHQRIGLLCHCIALDVGQYLSDRGRLLRQEALHRARLPVVKIEPRKG